MVKAKSDMMNLMLLHWHCIEYYCMYLKLQRTWCPFLLWHKWMHKFYSTMGTINIGHIVDNKLYMLNTRDYTPTLEQWHCKFGNLNYDYINQLAQGKLVEGINYSKGEVNKDCEACAQRKMHKLPFPKQSVKKTSRNGELIHSDLCGPMNVDSIGGSTYVLTFTDDFTRYVTAHFLKCEFETLSKFKEHHSACEFGWSSHRSKG